MQKKYLQILTLLFILGVNTALGQTANIYTFSTSSGTYTPLDASANEVTALETDDGTSSPINIGFTFNYCGNPYTQIMASSNGWVSFNTSITGGSYLNNATTELNNIKPALMPLWDDLSGAAGEAYYSTSGTSPNQVFTIEFREWRWNYNSSFDPTISFQVKLYEGSDKIEYVYNQEPGAGNLSSASATIGIVDGEATPNYLSINNTSTSPTASSTTFTTNLNTRPATGQVYTFVPPLPCAGTPDPGNAVSSVTSACPNLPFTLSLSTPITNSGYAFQWYSGPTGGTLSPIPGATGSTYTVLGQTVASDYYCVMTCTASGNNSNSSTVTVGQNPATECYCIPSSDGPTINYISNVTTTLGSTNFNQSSTSSSYTDYTATDIVTAVQNTTVNVAVTIPSTSSNTLITIWVDWNQNGVFTDPGEKVYVSPTAGLSFNTNILVPADAVPGNTRMRIRSDWYLDGAPTDPCDETDYGESEDYTFNVVEAVPCTGTPEAGTAQSTATSVCPNTPFTLSLSGASLNSGLTYQWFSRATGVGAFVPIVGATASNYTVNNLTAGTDYYCQLTCTSSGASDISVAVTVLQSNWVNCYCVPTYTNGGTGDNITHVVLNTLNDNFTGNDVPHYFDRTTVQNAVPDIMQGNTENLMITFGTDGNQYNGVWIDYDHSGSFEESEFISSNTNAGGSGTVTVPITIPATALTGETRLRIRGGDDSQPNANQPCGPSNSSFGIGLDYFVNIIPMPDCSEVTYPSEVLSVASPQTLCVSGDIHLNLSVVMPVASGITYRWQNSATETGVYNNLGTASATPAYTYNTSTSYWYRCQVLCNGSAILTSTPIEVEAVVPEAPTMIDGQHCGPGEVLLTSNTNGGEVFWYNDLTGTVPIHTGNDFTTPFLTSNTTYYASGGANPPLDTVVGTGTTGSTDAVSPFYYVYGGYKHQYLIQASELLAVGLHAGAINQIGFYVTSANPTTAFNDFSISMGDASVSNMSGGWQSVSEVLSPTTLNPTNGVNMITLDNAYNWDGVSNLVIQICYSNETTGGTSVAVRFSNTSYVSHKYYNADGTPVGTICSSTNSTTTQSKRPNFYFNASGCESERVPVTAYIRDTPTVDLGPDEDICGDANQSITLDAGNAGSTYLWSDGSTGQTLTVNQSGTYYVTVTNEFGCSSSDTTTKGILTAPVVNIGPSDTTICEGVTLTLDAGDDGTSYYWNTGSSEQSIQVNTNGQYTVIVRNDLNCEVDDTINVTVSGILPSIDAILVDNAGPYTFNFSVFNPQGAITGYTWDFGDGTTSQEIAPTHTYQDGGNYNVTLTLNTAECGLLNYTTSVHILGLDDIKVDDNVLNLYPNPAKDVITIDNKSTLKMQEIVVSNTLGQVIKQEKVKNPQQHNLNLSGFASGMYSVRIKTDKGFVIRKFEVLK